MQKVWAEAFGNLQPWKINYEGPIKIVSTETTIVGRPASKENRIGKSDNAMPLITYCWNYADVLLFFAAYFNMQEKLFIQ